MVVAAKELDIVVALVEAESQIAAALRAFQIAAKGDGPLCYGSPPAPGGLQALYLFPSYTVNDGLMDVEQDCPVFFRIFNPVLHGSAGDPVIREKEGIGTALVPGASGEFSFETEFVKDKFCEAFHKQRKAKKEPVISRLQRIGIPLFRHQKSNRACLVEHINPLSIARPDGT